MAHGKSEEGSCPPAIVIPRLEVFGTENAVQRPALSRLSQAVISELEELLRAEAELLELSWEVN